MNRNSIQHMARVVGLLLVVASLLALVQPALAQAAPPTGSTTATGASLSTAKYPAAVIAARDALAARLRMRDSDIKVVAYKYVVWRDSCMGVYIKGQACLDVIVPGYVVILSANGVRYEAHTNLTGSQIRWATATTSTSAAPKVSASTSTSRATITSFSTARALATVQ